MGGLRSLAAPARPVRLGGIPSQSPFRGGLSGNGMLPVFLQHLPPPVGACGERNYGLFFGIFFEEESKVGIPTLLPTTHIRPIFFHHKHPVSQNIKFDVC